MLKNITLTIFLQVLGDFACCIFAFYCGFFKNNPHRKFFLINSFAFLSLLIGDIYYNYNFRILRHSMVNSIDFTTTFTMLVFQFSQVYCWKFLLNSEKFKLFSYQNLPYILFSFVMIFILLYYFITDTTPSALTTWYQSAAVILNMSIWLYAIICLSTTRTLSVVLLTLGCLMLISSDLTMRCLFMVNANKIISADWVHTVWTSGVVIMALGFLLNMKKIQFTFCPNNSIQMSCCSWLSITSLVVFLIGFIFLAFLNFSHSNQDIRSMLWNLPIALVFTMIISVLFGNRFSKIILLPVNHFLKRIEIFNIDNQKIENDVYSSNIHEFKLLGTFMNESFKKLSRALDNEVKISEQVAHDIRSPLSALEMIIKRLPTVDERKKIVLRDAIIHIRNITNNLEKKATSEQGIEQIQVIQIAVLLEQLLAERDASQQNVGIIFEKLFHLESYSFFITAVPSIMKRVLTNIINNSCESIINGNGVVQIMLDQTQNDIVVKIIDTGLGISEENLSSIFTRGYTTKTAGTGLGLYYAKENISRWGGEINISSVKGNGTTIQIALPSESPPAWFVGCLFFSEKHPVVCVDDSISIAHLWEERLSRLSPILNLTYCKSLKDLRKKVKIDEQCMKTFLVDYEFSGEEYTGFDIINEIRSKRKQDRIFLVTSRSNESRIHNLCFENKIFLIPKSFAPEIPVHIVNELAIQYILVMSGINHNSMPVENRENLIIFQNINDFLANAAIFKTEIKLFIYSKFLTENITYEIKKHGFDYIEFENFGNFMKENKFIY